MISTVSTHILHELPWKLSCPQSPKTWSYDLSTNVRWGKKHILGSSFLVAFVHLPISTSSNFPDKVIRFVFQQKNNSAFIKIITDRPCLPWTSRETAKYNQGINFLKGEEEENKYPKWKTLHNRVSECVLSSVLRTVALSSLAFYSVPLSPLFTWNRHPHFSWIFSML